MLYTGNEHIDCKQPFMTVRNEYIKKLDPKVELVLLGDSITEGFNIQAYHPTNKIILNSGMSGDRIVSLKARLQRDVVDFTPKTVLLNIGINDLMHFEYPKIEGLDTRLNYLFDEYIKIVETIINSGCKLYCASIIKIAEQPYDEIKHHFANYMFINEHINILNAKIENYCKDNHIDYLNYNSALENQYSALDGSYTYDGLHLNQKGYFEIIKLLVRKGVL